MTERDFLPPRKTAELDAAVKRLAALPDPAMSEPTEQQIEAVARAIADAPPDDWQDATLLDRCRVLARVALAASSAAAPRQAEWQPISSAPKDGTFVLLWEPSSEDIQMETQSVGKFFDDAGWGTERGYPCDPSHWQPLPAPPAGDDETSDQEKT